MDSGGIVIVIYDGATLRTTGTRPRAILEAASSGGVEGLGFGARFCTFAQQEGMRRDWHTWRSCCVASGQWRAIVEATAAGGVGSAVQIRRPVVSGRSMDRD